MIINHFFIPKQFLGNIFEMERTSNVKVLQMIIYLYPRTMYLFLLLMITYPNVLMYRYINESCI